MYYVLQGGKITNDLELAKAGLAPPEPKDGLVLICSKLKEAEERAVQELRAAVPPPSPGPVPKPKKGRK